MYARHAYLLSYDGFLLRHSYASGVSIISLCIVVLPTTGPWLPYQQLLLWNKHIPCSFPTKGETPILCRYVREDRSGGYIRDPTASQPCVSTGQPRETAIKATSRTKIRVQCNASTMFSCTTTLRLFFYKNDRQVSRRLEKNCFKRLNYKGPRPPANPQLFLKIPTAFLQARSG